MNYVKCLEVSYPGITEADFCFEEDEKGLKLHWYNEATFGPAPTLESLGDAWLTVMKMEDIEEMNEIMYDEMNNGTSGYMIQGLNNNFRIDSSRSDLDNMKNLRDYCRQMIVAFTGGTYPANLGGQVTNNHPVDNPDGNWYGVISSFSIESGNWVDGNAQGVAYLNNCKGTLTPGETVYMYDNPERPPIAIPVYMIKDNMSGTMIKGFNNDFHVVTLQELDVIIFELQAYGLWLYQHKWEKVAQIMACTTVEQIEAITFWN